MANLHIRWREPLTGERLIRCSISDAATDEVLERVFKAEVDYVRQTHGEEVAKTVAWDTSTPAWKNRHMVTS